MKTKLALILLLVLGLASCKKDVPSCPQGQVMENGKCVIESGTLYTPH
jgi:hypothetical protein